MGRGGHVARKPNPSPLEDGLLHLKANQHKFEERMTTFEEKVTTLERVTDNLAKQMRQQKYWNYENRSRQEKPR